MYFIIYCLQQYVFIRRLSGKYEAILNISRTGRFSLMLAAIQRRLYCSSVNSHFPVGLVNWQWDTVNWACVLCDRRISQIYSSSKATLALGKTKVAGSQMWAVGSDRPRWCDALPKSLDESCRMGRRIVWSASSVVVNATVTQYTSSVNGVSLPTDYPHGRVTVHGWTVRSHLTCCHVISRPREQFSRYSKWLDTFRTALVYKIYKIIYNYLYIYLYIIIYRLPQCVSKD